MPATLFDLSATPPATLEGRNRAPTGIRTQTVPILSRHIGVGIDLISATFDMYAVHMGTPKPMQNNANGYTIGYTPILGRKEPQ